VTAPGGARPESAPVRHWHRFSGGAGEARIGGQFAADSVASGQSIVIFAPINCAVLAQKATFQPRPIKVEQRLAVTFDQIRDSFEQVRCCGRRHALPNVNYHRIIAARHGDHLDGYGIALTQRSQFGFSLPKSSYVQSAVLHSSPMFSLRGM
jgi:hypothetical protein